MARIAEGPSQRRWIRVEGGFTQRNSRQIIIVTVAAFALGNALVAANQHGEDKQLLSKLSASRHTLVDGIRQAEKTDGQAISAKMEMKGDQLMLSVNTAKQGRALDAEHNTLMELKYSPPGAEIRIRVISRQQGGQVIEVLDAGPGIDAQHHARIFDRFYRLDEGRSRERGGSGLGLAIAHWAIDANGGRIEVESEPGRGSLFRIVLPKRVSS